MTLLGYDAFTDANTVPKNEWDQTAWFSAVQTGRFGDTNGAVTAASGATAFKTYTMATAAATVIYGIAFNFATAAVIGATGSGAFQLGGMIVAGAVQCIVGTNASGFIEVRRGTVWNTGTIIATSTGHTAIGTAAYHQVEVKAVMHTSTGSVIVNLDGVQVINTGSVQTAATSGSVTAIRFGNGSASTNSMQYDDMYVADAVDATATQGRANNDFLGDLRVQVLYPTGAGDVTQWTPSSGANWTTVDETPPSTADFVSNATVGQQDLYTLTDLSGTVTTVYAVRECLYITKTDAGSVQVKPVFKENSVSTSDTAQGITVGAAPVYGTLRAVRPSDGAVWTTTDVNALQAGAEVA
jgi:hypothetical protein